MRDRVISTNKNRPYLLQRLQNLRAFANSREACAPVPHAWRDVVRNDERRSQDGQRCSGIWRVVTASEILYSIDCCSIVKTTTDKT